MKLFRELSTIQEAEDEDLEDIAIDDDDDQDAHDAAFEKQERGDIWPSMDTDPVFHYRRYKQEMDRLRSMSSIENGLVDVSPDFEQNRFEDRHPPEGRCSGDHILVDHALVCLFWSFLLCCGIMIYLISRVGR